MQERFFNRELSWLEFNARVLFQGLNKDLPLLERLQFLSIVTSNFDEFFQVRVAAIKRLLAENPGFVDVSGLTPQMVYTSVAARAHQIIRSQQECLMSDILPALANEGFVYVTPMQYTQQQSEYLSGVFNSDIFPLLTPLRTDTEAFPHIKNLTTYAAFRLAPIAGIKMASGSEEFRGDGDAPRIALVEIPDGIPNIYWLAGNGAGAGGSGSGRQFALLQDVVAAFGTKLFPGFEVEETLLFKVTRDADFAVDEDAGKNFIHAMEDVLIQRKSSFPVQMTCNASSTKIQKFLMEKLELKEEDVYRVDQIINPGDLMELREADEDGSMSFESWEHFYPADLPEEEPYWDTLKLHDKILHVPYESYDPVVKFISDAADDDDVLAIKMTLYRTGRNSPIIDALERAAQRGKQVVVLVELKARFDEENNILWAKRLEQAGCHVIYGLVGLKTHSKITLVVRKEEDGIRRYVHLGTGNYNDSTAKLYTDIGLLTADEEIGEDATAVFNMLSGYSEPRNWNKLSLAPLWLKDRFLYLINREKQHALNGEKGHMICKMNSVCDADVIKALYEAAQAGVKIELIVRGICAIKLNTPDINGNIKIRSIVGNFLEHARIFYFENGGLPEYYCSSADWMPRNLERRVEILFPIEDDSLRKKLDFILQTQLKDNVKAFDLQEDGSYLRKKDQTGSLDDNKDDVSNESINSQLIFCEQAARIAKDLGENRDERVFVPKMSHA